jgi:hypothetical protein
MIEENIPRCDDVAHILIVKFETYQIQMGVTISDFMFCTYTNFGRRNNNRYFYVFLLATIYGVKPRV